jgi:predicted nucleic acid-binding Zn ribbon protein
METKPIKKAEIEQKVCLECGSKIIGRADKKFCSDQCRVAYNNRLNSNETNFMRNVNNVLRKNRRILIDLNTTGKSRVSREKLHEKGFDFSLFTSTYTTKEGSLYHYCYEQGYLQVDKSWYLLVVKKETI